MKKYILHIVLLLVIGCVSVYGAQRIFAQFNFDTSNIYAHFVQSANEITESFVNQQKEDVTIYSVLVGGDIMMDRGVKAKVMQNTQDYHFIFDLIRDDLNEADLVFANLEGSISDIGADTGKKYSFRFEPAVTKALSDAGIDIVSLANNHMLDWGRDSLCETTKHLTEHNIDFVGAGCNSSIAERPHIQTLGNTRIAFLAYTEFYQGAHATQSRSGMTEFHLEKIMNRIDAIKSQNQADLVFVSMHWGEEYKTRSNEFQQNIAHQFVDAGADVVIGHHPHVTQEIERYGNGWIIYSLGNFVFDQSFSEETMRGLLADIHIQNKRVYDIVPVHIQLNNNFQPYILK